MEVENDAWIPVFEGFCEIHSSLSISYSSNIKYGLHARHYNFRLKIYKIYSFHVLLSKVLLHIAEVDIMKLKYVLCLSY